MDSRGFKSQYNNGRPGGNGSQSRSKSKPSKDSSKVPSKFVSRKDLRKQAKQDKKQKHADYFHSRSKSAKDEYQQQQVREKQQEIQKQKQAQQEKLRIEQQSKKIQQLQQEQRDIKMGGKKPVKREEVNDKVLGKRFKEDVPAKQVSEKRQKVDKNISNDRQEFLKQNEVERQKLDMELKYLEKKLGIKDDKKRKKINKAIEVEGFGDGFMDFLDGIEGKLKVDTKKYEPKEYVFSDGEGPEEGDLENLAGQGGAEESDQEGFDEFMSEEEDENDELDEFDDEDEEEEQEEEEDEEEDDGEDSQGAVDQDNDDEDEEIDSEIYGNEDGDEDLQNGSDVQEDDEDMNDNESNEDQDDFEDDDDEEDDDENEDEEQIIPKKQQSQASKTQKAPFTKQQQAPKVQQIQLQLENPALEKLIRSVLNKVSEGNLEIMFNQLLTETKPYFKNPLQYAYCYSKLFIQMNIQSKQQMTSILSVNCAFISALHRILGDQFFATAVRQMFIEFQNSHNISLGKQPIVGPAIAKIDSDMSDAAKDRVKNLLNCFLHFFIFQSLSSSLLIDLIRLLMNSFEESDIEVLIFLLHNIGLQLRKSDPEAIRDIIQMSEQKKNSFAVELKMIPQEDPSYDQMKKKERKIGFLNMELQDIKNNKGTMTLQVKSIEHLQTWIRKNAKLQSELEFQPVDMRAETISNTLQDDQVLMKKWWLPLSQQKNGQDLQGDFQKPKDFKAESKKTNDILELASKQRMNTDIKKAVFQAIAGAEDYIQAFENCIRLNLKKQQEREIVKVLMHCCINEKGTFNKFYALLAQRLIKYQPQSFKYSLKYTLWDYLKTISKFDIRQIANMARIIGFLIGEGDVPLNFLKVINFDQEGLSQPMHLFLFVLFDSIYDSYSKDQIKSLFKRGISEKHSEFRKGISEYLLTKFYLKKKKEFSSNAETKGKMPTELQTKIKMTFDILNRMQEGEFMRANQNESGKAGRKKSDGNDSDDEY